VADASHEISQTPLENKPQDSPRTELTYILPSLMLPLLVSAVVVGCVLLYRAHGYAWLSPSLYARIAFMSDRQGNWQLYMMDRNGSHLRNLTNSPSNDGVAVHSPGQNWLIFTSDRNGPSPNLDLFMMDLEGQNVHNLTPGSGSNGIAIALSPDGKNLAFSSKQSGSTKVLVAQVSAGELLAPLNLSERDQAGSFDDWSPKTDLMLMTVSSGVGRLSLLTSDLAGNIHRVLTDASYLAFGGRWSPDGKQVAFMARQSGGQAINIYRIDAAGGEPVNLTQSNSNNGFPQWSPDGSKIAFISDRDGNLEIYVMNADGKHLTNLTNNPADDASSGDFVWSPDGAQILFQTNRDGNAEVYIMNADGSNPVNLTNSPGADFKAIWVE
jgi:Tol biopolymer transport system component